MLRLSAFVLAIIGALSIYIYWPLWQELQGREVDQQMAMQTQIAQNQGAIDPTYTQVAKATGGDVCYSGGNTVEEKNENLKRCMTAFEHRSLVKMKNSLVRDRFLEIKSQVVNSYFIIFIFLYSLVFSLVNTDRKVSPMLFSLACAILAAGSGYIWFQKIALKTKREKNLGAAFLALMSLVPCGLIALIAGSC